MSQQAQRCSKRVKGLVASPGLVSFTRRRRASKGDEGRPEEPEAEQQRKQSCGNEAEATGSGAEAGESASQVETNPAGHGQRGRCGYAQKERRASEGDSEERGERGAGTSGATTQRTAQGSAAILFSPERKEVSGGLEWDRWSEDEDLFSPVRLQFGRLTANDRGSENSVKTVSGATQEPEPGKETRNGAGTSGATTQRTAQGSAAGVGGGIATGNQTIAHQAGGGNRPGLPGTQQTSQRAVSLGRGRGRAGYQPGAQLVSGGFQPGPPNRPNGMAMIKFKAPSAFSGKQGEDAADWMEMYETTAEYNRWGETEKRANFGMYLDGPARKWFQCLNSPALWVDTPAVPAGGGAAGTSAVDGLKTRTARHGNGFSASTHWVDGGRRRGSWGICLTD